MDNLIQIAHNVEIGQNTVIAAQAGISGSTKLGKNIMMGGVFALSMVVTIMIVAFVKKEMDRLVETEEKKRLELRDSDPKEEV